MHYREAAANVITNDALDPVVKIPEFKVCAVSIEVIKTAAGSEYLATSPPPHGTKKKPGTYFRSRLLLFHAAR